MYYRHGGCALHYEKISHHFEMTLQSMDKIFLEEM